VIATGLRRVSGEPDATTPEVRTETLGQVLPDGMPRMLYIFGTWCPNCADATRTVNGFFQRYGSRGLRVAGLAFEHDTGRAVDLLDRYAEKNGLRFPMMVGGFSDKAAAGERVPFLDKVRAYPTTVFIRRDGTIAGVHSGFSGPATGDAYRELIQEWDALIREIVQ
jgi:thiol-disulfide isomerase/thioredoxin